MTEEPYRWLEAVGNRREYVREQLKGGSPVFAASLPDGILLLGVGGGQSKVFELFDRHALAGLGHPADIEKIRQTAIDAAHMEAFTRAIPLGRIGQPDDLPGAILFFASADAGFVTGQVLSVSGGLTMNG